ncbi:MAG: hypothetical protein SOT34_00795 [Candidatus Borkfalkiaceae bacterium]|nr:hypothetical protein [Christensenellaceae bacterium]
MTYRNKKEVLGVVDVGSNSVRALVTADGKILYKDLITTRLGEGLATTGEISPAAAERTADAVRYFVGKIKGFSPAATYAFATEAVRSGRNGEAFREKVMRETGVFLDVLSGEEEGEVGLLGALGGKDGGIVDIGGASAEITAAKDGAIVYSHSLPLGAVRLFDACGEDIGKIEKTVSALLPEYGKVPAEVDYRAIGGTATAIAAIDLRLVKYDWKAVNGHLLTAEAVGRNLSLLRSLSVKERISRLHMTPKRAEIIVGGAAFLLMIMQYVGLSSVRVSESDNMLGYLRKKVFGEGYEKR